MASYNRFLSGHAIHLRQSLPVSEVERCEVELSGSMGKRTAAASSLLSLHESFLPEAAPSDDFETLQSRVEAARCKVPGCGTVLNLVAAFNLAFRALLSFDSVLGCVIAVASVILYGRGGASVGLSFGLDWNLVSMAVIFPISQCIGWSFGRREMALSLLSTVMSLVTRLWSAVHTWKVKDGGEWRRMSELLEPPAGREQLHDLFGRLLSTLVAYFAVPRYMRLRHVMRLYGAAEDQARRHALANEFKLLVDGSLSQLQARRGRYAGPPGRARARLPGGEAHRLDSYISQIGIAWEQLTAIKEYRTPQALRALFLSMSVDVFRAFSRVYVLIMPVLYGPYYASIVEEAEQSGDDPDRALLFAILFACAVQLASAGLVNLMIALEDPFAQKTRFAGNFDRIRVSEIAEATRRHLLLVEQQAPDGWVTASRQP
ncbi:hypothetical protein EMIHUDRAFT_121349 [Emiliania huxleyi CCMP1516]|uniref:ABC transmembrane type-1 domain-containing protein n=2 Tax=Emiliania huxleyi TaxID=2903 RepID=A0A0D3I4Q4_EMIH1|nr:hypothetical protein EMIHUDRAFT_121349 [Emiliania huxleyi CCMP1516]EOD06239.1 hypothetical protein EMIHUDRAFT_121349 [Emiliania huxleyi CCMP1516]|eukprot:XP_005758668.1 hypothetical protein EMIHUDRAFT_121349 [Emiliania huxleyi CCMP1516]